MNPCERLARRLKGEPVDRPPNLDIFMTFASHFIHQPLSRYYLDYRVLVEANLAVLEAFELDLVQVISDPYREGHDFGLQVEFPYDNLPLKKTNLIIEPEDLNDLQIPDPATGPRMIDRLEAIRCLRQQVAREVPVMGWVEGALAEAAVLRGDVAIMFDLYDRPEWLKELLEVCVGVEIAFAKAQIEAGADIIGLGDAIASQISPRAYQEFALPYERRIIQAVHESGGLARLHICGDITHLLHLVPHSGADIIDLDWMVDMRAAAQAIGERAAPCGNFDPVAVMLQGTPEDVYHATLSCLRDAGERAISAAGCEIPDQTPVRNLHAQTRALWDFQPG